MIKSRNKQVVIKNQFNINGSRGKDAGKFISDYVSRSTATEPSMAYRPNPNQVPVMGDGVAFTMNQTAITRKETLDIAQHVQDLHATGKRAIQQMVISFEPQYLVDQKIVPNNVDIFNKGDYEGNYDDVRLRNVVRTGLQSLIDNEGYRDGKAIACIQWDTTHLHVHAVVYEDAKKIARKRGNEEKGVIKPSSFNQMAFDIQRKFKLTKPHGLIPNQKTLSPKPLKNVKEIDADNKSAINDNQQQSLQSLQTPSVDYYLDFIHQQQLVMKRKYQKRLAEEKANKEKSSHNLHTNNIVPNHNKGDDLQL